MRQSAVCEYWDGAGPKNGDHYGATGKLRGVPGVTAAGLVKRFGDFTALAGVDFEVPEGQLVGLLGPNGAGKTTTIRMLATLTGRSCLPHFRAGVCERTMDEYEDPEFPR